MSAGVRRVWIIVLAVLANGALGGTQPSVAQEGAAKIERPPVGGLFGLFGAGRRAASPTPEPSAPRLQRAPAAEPTAKPARPSPVPTETTTPATPKPTTTRRPIVTPEPTIIPSPTPSEMPEPSPTPPVGAGKKGKAKPTATAEPTATPSREEEGGMEPLGTPEPEATEEPLEEPTPRAAPREPARGEAPADPHGEGPSGKSDVQLPNVEIQGDLERPDIFFVMPRAKDLSDEQLMRARIKREITRPVIKDWVEEEMLLK